MPFWAYMLHCRGGAFYVGHTDDLTRRMGEHQSGSIPGFTSARLPVELAWSQEFQVRDDAKAAERRIKGWSRAEKLAMIRGDWALISELAKSKDSPSTGSGGTEAKQRSLSADCPELVEGSYFTLQRHPEQPSVNVRNIAVRVSPHYPHWLTLRWRIEGARSLSVPPFAGRARANDLWRTTCFELFVRSDGETGYTEFNLSPSERWAAYDFTGYRDGMTERPMPRDPVCTLRGAGDVVLFEAAIPRAALPSLPAAIGISAVIEEEGGVKSYWALAHPDGAPDFHDPACFALSLAAPAGI